MNIKHLAVAAALMLTATTSAFAADGTGSAKTVAGTANITDIVGSSFSVLVSGVYTLTLGVTANNNSGKNAGSSMTATIAGGVGSVKTLLSQAVNSLDVHLDSGSTYSYVWSAFHAGNRFEVLTGNTTLALKTADPVTAVPGPEAGAGLGALALGGMALYMKRRRQEEAKAA